MSDPIEKLVDALRNELQQYGETLALLDSQNESPGTHLILNGFTLIERQRIAIEAALEQRRICQAHLAWSSGNPECTAPADIVRLAPENYRPLLEALLSETAELLARVRERARQNQDQLQRTHRLMQQFIDGIRGECPVVIERTTATDPESEEFPNYRSPKAASQ